MLASWLAPYITGQYDVTCVPIALPSALVTILLPTLWSDGAPIFLTRPELARTTGFEKVPDPGPNKRWVFVQVGQQKSTGVGFGPGRKTFYEAKLEIPFLRHPHSRDHDDDDHDDDGGESPTPFTYKHTILFSSWTMAFSSQHISGLNSSKVGFQVDDDLYQVEGYFSVKRDVADDDPNSQRGEALKWDEEMIKRAFESWFVGESTGQGATRFQTENVVPSRPRTSLHVRIHLPTLTSLPLEAVQKLVGPIAATTTTTTATNRTTDELDSEGWYDVRGVEGWELSVNTRMEVKRVTDV